MLLARMTTKADLPDLSINGMLENEMKTSIMLILGTYRSLNLRQISKVLGITEPSTHVHIKEMLEDGYIELDGSMAGKRGKYYKLTKEVQEYLENDEESLSFDENTDFSIPEIYKTAAKAVHMVSLLSMRFGTYSARYLLEHMEEQMQRNPKLNERGEEHISISNVISGQLSFIPLANEGEFDEIKQAFKVFADKIDEISKRNISLKGDAVKERVMITSLAIPLLKVDPRD